MFSWRLTEICFSGGDIITLEPGSVLRLIGPNSGGKSTALLDIHQAVANPGQARKAVASVTAHTEGTGDDLRVWMGQNYAIRRRGGGEFFVTTGGEIAVASVENQVGSDPLLSPLNPFLVHRLDTESRLGITRYANSINLLEEVPQQYIHVLQGDRELERSISDEVREAFGVALVINWGAGRQVGFHVGDTPPVNSDVDRVSPEYLNEVAKLPRLEQDGDGVRSFFGALLAARCGAHPLLLLDEPEAFLHPPQTRRLAAALSRSAQENRRQVVIATHSADVIRGLMQGPADVAVCRIEREGEFNHASVLPPERISEMWSKPLLRSAAAMEGVFHRGVVVCEGDADATFYELILARLEEKGRIQHPDLYFVHGGGKGQLATLAASYGALGTRTAVIGDFDLLRNQSEFAAVVASLEMDFDSMRSQYISVTNAIDPTPVIGADEFSRRAKEVITQVERGKEFTPEHRRELQGLLADASDWSKAKRHGVSELRGGTRKALDGLMDICKSAGLFLVPVGELEAWWPSGPTEKSEWFPAASREFACDPSAFSQATDFVLEVSEWLTGSRD